MRRRTGIAVLWLALALELGAPLMLMSDRLKLIWCVFLLIFHLGNWLIFSVDFRENMLLLLIAAIPISTM